MNKKQTITLLAQVFNLCANIDMQEINKAAFLLRCNIPVRFYTAKGVSQKPCSVIATARYEAISACIGDCFVVPPRIG
jgi:hypothetical protein